MPRLSLRTRILQNLDVLRGELAILGIAIPPSSDSEDDDDSSGDSVILTIANLADIAYEKISSQRYVFRNLHRAGYSKWTFNNDLKEEGSDDDDEVAWLSEEEFLQKYRMHRVSFWKLVSLIKDHRVFHPTNAKKPQAPPEHQLLVLLYYLGTCGSAGNNPRLRNAFGLGRGTIELYRNRCVLAIMSMRNDVIKWPDVTERIEIATRMEQVYKWPGCIAIADGTLFPLTYEPQSEDAPDYSGRKHRYSLSVMIVNDDKRKIRYYYSGMPGSAHDMRVFRKTPLFTNPEAYFGTRYYLLGDSAFTCSHSRVASFKAPNGYALGEDETKFNTHVGRLRILSEHTIGILKGRFPWLKSIPMVITENPKSVKKILKYIDCCVILHNLLVESDEVPEDWLDIGEEDLGGEQNEMPEELTAPLGAEAPDDARRSRLMAYFKDYVF
jgi:hypothetical protein